MQSRIPIAGARRANSQPRALMNFRRLEPPHAAMTREQSLAGLTAAFLDAEA